MAEGPGKYGDVADALLQHLNADAVFITILGGQQGSGSCLVTKPSVTERVNQYLPDKLRQIADDIGAIKKRE